MRPYGKLIVVLTVFVSFLNGDMNAMPVENFARMNDDDASTFVTLLVEGSAKMLRNQGNPDQAQKAIRLFKDASKQGGLNQFVMNLKQMNAANNRNAINPNNRAHVFKVEDAMALTLKESGIIVPASYLLIVDKDFTPIGPPRQASTP